MGILVGQLELAKDESKKEKSKKKEKKRIQLKTDSTMANKITAAPAFPVHCGRDGCDMKQMKVTPIWASLLRLVHSGTKKRTDSLRMPILLRVWVYRVGIDQYGLQFRRHQNGIDAHGSVRMSKQERRLDLYSAPEWLDHELVGCR